MDDIRAVMDAAGSERAAVMGESEGGPLAMLFVAAHPERTVGLILQGAEVRERKDDDWPWGESTEEEFEAYISSLPETWGSGRTFQRLAPSVGDAEWARAWYGRMLKNAVTPSAWAGFARMAFDIDVRDVVSTITVPTLIVHAVGDQVCNVENARFLARTTFPGSILTRRSRRSASSSPGGGRRRRPIVCSPRCSSRISSARLSGLPISGIGVGVTSSSSTTPPSAGSSRASTV